MFFELLALSACAATLRPVHEVDVTDHAVSRYRERVRPGLSLDDCERELLRVLALAEVRESPPEWFRPRSDDEAVAWAFLGDGIVFPVHRAPQGHLVAVTCLTKLGCSEATLVRRRERKARRRAGRRRNADSRRGTSRRRDEPVAA